MLQGPLHPLVANWTLDGAFTQMLAARPELRDKPALLTDEGNVSFRELSTRAHLLSRALRPQLHAKSSSLPQAIPLVGVCLSRGPALAEVLLAVLQAGGAYLPLDPRYPTARLAHLVADAAPALIVAEPEHEELVRQLAPQRPYWVMDPRTAMDRKEDPLAPAEPPSPSAGERPFAVLYTSGSTGQPRGVCLPHRAAQNRFQWMWRTVPFSEGEVCCWKTPLGFVDSIWELFGALLQGIPVAVAPEGLEKQPERLLAFAVRHGVSRLIVVPSLLRLLLPHLSPLPGTSSLPAPALRLWTCSGEPLPPSLAETFLTQRPGSVLLNLYGSTEVMGDVTAHVVRAGEDPLPIGRPVDNTTLELLDDTGAPVKVGERGTLHVRGANLALGPVGSASASTAWTEKGQRYCTGDLARMVRAPIDGDWTLLHEGRRDRQIKLFGNRFDLAELERALLKCEGVMAAVALVHEDPEGPTLLGFVQPHEPGAVTQEALRAACAEALPPYARPALHLLAHWPLLPNGKLDRQQLLALGMGRASPGKDPFKAAWRAVLPQSPEEEETDFFQAGGTSVLAVDLLRRLRAAGVTVSLERFYAAPSLGALRRGKGRKATSCDFTVRALASARGARGTASLNLLADRFDETDPLKHALGATRADLHAMFTSYLEACGPEGLSFEAVDGHGKQVGCVVAGDLFRVHAHAREGRFVVAQALEPLDAALSAVSDPWCHRPPEPGPGEWVYVLFLAATGQREVARLTRELETAVIDSARARGYRGLVTVNSHALTQQVCEELGYRTEARLDVREFLHEGTRPFARVPADGAELHLHVLRL
ncbi:non-ribosomal peptide synthetase [Stigmatella sp. ncwal1]|uniref:Non-ribosomal peptide synthetase n=1 Tax=Stigmatella ashevillensis TaxID=2995309 RepID=A0ABT5DAR6_9BACT|nr:non-ribosomal peptide synthetase [Stigmatella ashevillena]MDC0710742.1 non-ribosomal peptide synthetase [Stigmatella ashevillena]